jgi:hypothetical protein
MNIGAGGHRYIGYKYNELEPGSYIAATPIKADLPAGALDLDTHGIRASEVTSSTLEDSTVDLS